MSTDSKASTSIKRSLGNSRPTDVGRGIIRLTRSDSNLLGARFNDLLEIKSQAGARAFAKCFFVHPVDETSYAGKVQVDSLTLSALGMGPHSATSFAMVEISKSQSLGCANSITLEPVTDESGLPPDPQKFDARWVTTVLEDKPLWKGALVAVPAEGKMSLFRIVSIDPPVAIGTMLTKMELAGRNETAGQATSSKLFGFGLVIRLKKTNA